MGIWFPLQAPSVWLRGFAHARPAVWRGDSYTGPAGPEGWAAAQAQRSPPSVGPRTLRPQVQSVTRSVGAKGPRRRGLFEGVGGAAGSGGRGCPGRLGACRMVALVLAEVVLADEALPHTVQVKVARPCACGSGR